MLATDKMSVVQEAFHAAPALRSSPPVLYDGHSVRRRWRPTRFETRSRGRHQPLADDASLPSSPNSIVETGRIRRNSSHVPAGCTD